MASRGWLAVVDFDLWVYEGTVPYYGAKSLLDAAAGPERESYDDDS